MNVTKSLLKALAGWTLIESFGGGSKAAALSKLRDGCEEALEFVPETESDSKPVIAAGTPPATIPPISRHAGACKHRFHIKTQRCVYCGTTYLNATGREAECLG